MSNLSDPSDLEAQKDAATFTEKMHKIHSVRGGTTVEEEMIQIGNKYYHRSELENAYAGDLQPGIHAPRQDNYANPVPLGLTCTAICLMALSLLNLNINGNNNPTTMAGAALLLGGTIQTMAGFMCFFTGNTFALVSLSAYGGFWFSYGAILTQSFGIALAYKSVAELERSFGYFIAAFTIFTFIILMCTVKGTWALFVLFLMLFCSLLLLTISAFTANHDLKKAAGYFGFFASVAGFYDVYAGLATKHNSYFAPKAYLMPGAPRV